MTDAPTAPGLDLPSLDLALPAQAAPYRVLARKYRPSTFAELIGQEPMVRTLSNAISSGRLAQGFMLTGVRGVGKTTTARIIARGLNCIGADGTGGPTIEPCGVCVHCTSIAESRHVDVLEMDAASRTGIDDIRELIDGVRYAPNSARYKVYIIDEVHMLSDKAFNALLKTLEEPPPHVKFIMATTEIRKVPVTVLSRCQRFDLRRIETGRLMQHLGQICTAEGVAATTGALALVARAAEGSVRDALSLLDQAIAHAGAGTGGDIAEEPVREMLGLADRDRIFDLFGHLMAGRMAEALAELRDQYDAGAEPLVVLEDLLETTHWLSRLKAVPDAGDDATTTELERTRGRALAAQLDMATLSRVWQILLKGLGEARHAPSALSAVEMVLIRLCHAADLPSPADLVRELTGGARAAAAPRPTPPAAPSGGARASNVVALRPRVAEPPPLAMPADFESLVALVGEHKEAVLYSNLVSKVRPVAFAPGRLELNLGAAPPGLPRELAAKLKEWTGQPWQVIVNEAQGGATVGEQKRAEEKALRARTEQDPLVRMVLEAFPGAELGAIRDRLAPEPVDLPEEAVVPDLPMADDDLVFPDFLEEEDDS